MHQPVTGQSRFLFSGFSSLANAMHPGRLFRLFILDQGIVNLRTLVVAVADPPGRRVILLKLKGPP